MQSGRAVWLRMQDARGSASQTLVLGRLKAFGNLEDPRIKKLD